MSDDTIVEIKDVWKTYRSDGYELNALRGVNIRITRGEFISIMGPSGCGKSTLLHLMGALDSVTRGEVRFEEKIIAEMSEDERCCLRCRRTGFIFQTFNLLPTLNILENVEMPARLSGLSKKERREKAKTLLEKVGLSERLTHLPSQLSGGERQRVAIARALINAPELILADEPTGNLDSKSGSEIIGLLHELNSEGQTIIMVTHNPETTKYSNRIVYMRDGKIIG
jgi:putative ABC transport system ATP-binding protein